MNREVDDEVAQVLNLVRLCLALHVLPQSGGLLDQDSYFVFLLEHVLVADAELAERKAP
jgi:hypothetical protein